MEQKITVTLSDKAAGYLAELRYSLTDENDKPETISGCINSSLEALAEFEKETDNQLWNWLGDFKKAKEYDSLKELLCDPGAGIPDSPSESDAL